MTQPDIQSVQAPFTDELIELGGVRFHFRDWSCRTDGGPILVLLHGFTGHARSWDPFAAAMSDGFGVLALDLRGHGESAWASSYSINDMVSDLDGFVAALPLKRFSLAGLSLGGMMTMAYASRRPNELAAATVVDIGPEMAAAGLNRIRTYVRSSDVFDTPDEAFTIARRDNDRPPEVLHRLRSDAGLMRIGTGQWTYRYDGELRKPGTLKFLEPSVIWSDCEAIEVPTLIVRGEQSDILSTEIADRMAKAIPNSRIATIANAGHGVPYDAPEAFLHAVRDFLENPQSGGAPSVGNGVTS